MVAECQVKSSAEMPKMVLRLRGACQHRVLANERSVVEASMEQALHFPMAIAPEGVVFRFAAALLAVVLVWPAVARGEPAKVFLNFDGAALVGAPSPSNAPSNKTNLIVGDSLNYPAMQRWDLLGGRDRGMADILTEMRILWVKVAVEFVTTRPSTGDYTMAVVGGGPKVDGTLPNLNSGGAANDCGNANKNDLVLVFGDASAVLGARWVAVEISHYLGDAFGLDHVVDQSSIMFPGASGQEIVSSTVVRSWTVSNTKDTHCGASPQDDLARLIANVGAGAGDSTPPLVWFRRPGPGAVLPGNFSAEVLAVDDLRVHHVVISLDGQKQIEFARGPYATFFRDLSAGEHLLRAEAADHMPNTAVAELKITVNPMCPTDGTCNAGLGAISGACTQGTQCASGLCTVKGATGQCTMACAGAGALCPSGTTCAQSDGTWACLPGPGWTLEGANGGCAIVEPRDSASLLFVYFGTALLFGLRRRRRRLRAGTITS